MIYKNISKILNLLGSLLILQGFILITPIFISILYHEDIHYLYTFLVTLLISLITGIILKLIFKNHNVSLSITYSMLLCALSWIIISIIGSIPFMIGINKSFIDAFFESISGFTTTGITVFTGLDSMPSSILYWRALIQWLGGLGILTFFLFVTFQNEGDLWFLFTAESHKIDSSRPFPNIFKTVTILWSIYILLTMIEIITLWLLKVPLFESILHSFTTLSTGGFSNHDLSVGYYQSIGHTNYKAIEYVITIFMFLGGMNFLMHFNFFIGNFKKPFTDKETTTYTKYILVFTAIIILSKLLISFDLSNMEVIFRKTIFQIVSVITTTGFGTEDIGSSFFTSVAKQIFLILMLIGGCVGSTSGGIKVIRVVILSKLMRREIRRLYLPSSAELPIVLEKSVFKDQEIFKISGLVFGWILLIIVGAFITALFSDLGPMESLSGMLSAVGNIGPFYFSVDKMISLSPIIKITFIFGMLAGRLEILPIFLLFNYNAWRR